MARNKGVDTGIGLYKGFVTEVNPVAPPQEVLTDIDNCIIDTDGTIRRRGGVNLETSFALNSVASGIITQPELESFYFSCHLWKAVSNSGTLNIVVVQVGATLQFYAQFGSLSQNLLGEYDLTTHALDIGALKTSRVEVSAGLGNLYVVNRYMEPVRIEYDGATFTGTPITIRIRDFEGLDDGLEVDDRPSELSNNHLYNLLNQGWTLENITKFSSLSPSSGAGFFSKEAVELIYQILFAGISDAFPSNADIMHVGIVTNSDGDLEFNSSFVKETFNGNTPAPKGHFILEAFNQQRGVVSNIIAVGDLVIPTRPAAVTFHNGRVFYSHPHVQGRVGGVFYSQQLTTQNKEGNCFQEADPTADQINELVATDGGYLPIPGIGEIFKLLEFGNGVVILASNGVWHMSGVDIGSSLSATSIRSTKVSEAAALGASSIVEVEGSLMFLGIDGIMQVTASEIGLQVVNLSQQTIQTFYISISAASRADAAAVYIPEQRKVYWAYREAFASVTPSTRSFNRFLVLDLDIQGFYKYSIGNDATQTWPEIVGMTLVKPLAEGTEEVPLLDLDGSIITENDGVTPVTSLDTVESGQISSLKLALATYSSVESGYKMTFGGFISRSFTEWVDFDVNGVGIAMTSFVDYAQMIVGAPQTKGTPTWVQTFFNKDSKNLKPGGYYELPPRYYISQGLRISQSVLEICNKPSSNMRASQSVIEVLMVAPSDFQVSQSVLEVVSSV